MRSKQARRARLQCAGRALREARVTRWALVRHEDIMHWFDLGTDRDAQAERISLDDAAFFASQHAEAMVARAAR